jgi:hypothetical protein
MANLPAPAMADALDAAAQGRILAAVAGRDYPVDELLRPSVVAPFVLKYREIRPPGAEDPVYGIDVYFAARGDLHTLADKDSFERWRSGRQEHKVHVLTVPELAARKLVERLAPQRQERYGHVVFSVLDRVELSATLHTVTTRNPASVLAVAHVDPCFADDSDFANRWRPVHRDDDGRPNVGPPRPYAGAAAYVKVTSLHEPAGTLFVEYHLVFVEPRAWFGGANLLRSKVPVLAQSEIRAFRRELTRAKK